MVLTASATRRFPPRGEEHAPRRSRCATITGAAPGVVTVASSAFRPRTLVVAEPGTLLGVAVDLDHGVVDIDEREPAAQHSRQAWARREQPGQVGQREQEPGRDRVELADVAVA